MPSSLKDVTDIFALRITKEVSTILDTPEIARQFLPDIRELDIKPDELFDPIGDEDYSPTKGIIHRYKDRVLLKATQICAVNCRFCFRREMLSEQESALNQNELEKALDYISQNDDIWEVILTGGDPLILSPRRLDYILKTLDKIPHVKNIRLHTRIPIIEPQRITKTLIKTLTTPQTTIWVAIHANHASEFTNNAKTALKTISQAGIPMISQTVLLKDINDNPITLTTLMRCFVENRIKPYYLHHLDKAKGISHFKVTQEKGKNILAKMRGPISGLCQPTYMIDSPTGEGKKTINI